MSNFVAIFITLLCACAISSTIDTDALNTQQSFAKFSYKNKPGMDTLTIQSLKDPSKLVIACAGDGTLYSRQINVCRNEEERPILWANIGHESPDLCVASVCASDPNTPCALTTCGNLYIDTKREDFKGSKHPTVEIAEDGAVVTYNIHQGEKSFAFCIKVYSENFPQFMLSGTIGETPRFSILFKTETRTPKIIPNLPLAHYPGCASAAKNSS